MFAVLADPVRRLIVETLASGEHAVAELTDIAAFDFHVSRSAVSHHLRILRDEHIVIARQDSASRMYRLHPGAMDRLDREVDVLRDRWENRTGWPYLVDPVMPARRHRPDRSGRRGRTRPDWQRPWLTDPIEDEGDGEHRWVAEGARPGSPPGSRSDGFGFFD